GRGAGSLQPDARLVPGPPPAPDRRHDRQGHWHRRRGIEPPEALTADTPGHLRSGTRHGGGRSQEHNARPASFRAPMERTFMTSLLIRRSWLAALALVACAFTLPAGAAEAPDALVKRQSTELLELIKTDPGIKAGDQSRIL